MDYRSTRLHNTETDSSQIEGVKVLTLVNCNFIKDGAYKFKGVFARFTECAGKADLKSIIEVQKENWG